MKARMLLGLLAVIGALGSAAMALECTPCTQVGGLIVADTTWDLAHSPYCLVQSVVVGNGATLTIEAGVDVCVNAGLGLTVGHASFGAGTLVARGTDAQPIRFAGSGSQPPAGFWGSIYFTNYAVDATYDPNNGPYVSGSVLEYVEVTDAGAASTQAVWADQSSPYLGHCRVHHSTQSGIRANGSNAPAMRIEQCEVWDVSSLGSAGSIIVTGASDHQVTSNNVHNCTGRGIYVNARCTLENNTVRANGYGGVYIESSSDGSTIANNTISDNVLNGDHGGGLRLQDADNCHITGNTITGNTLSQSNRVGGGIYLYQSTGCELSGNTISGNISTSRGGGAALDQSGGAELTNNTIADNTAQIGNGGGLSFYNSANCTVSGNTVTGNTAQAGYGGGMMFEASSGCAISASTISGNSALSSGGWGGGIAFYNSASGSVTGSSITGNTAQAGAGGVIFENSANGTLAGCTIMSNVAQSSQAAGSGFWTSGGSTVRDCFIAFNQAIAPNMGAIYITGGDGSDISLVGDPNTGLYNTICCNATRYCIYNNVPFKADGSNDVDARYVRWCTEDSLEIQDCIYDYFDNSAKSFVLWYPPAPHIPGDLNCDEVVDFDDINPFVQALAGYDGYHAEYPHCNWLLADCNDDCQVDFDDINPFVDLLSGG